VLDGLERAIAMAVVVDDHEPLLGGAEDHRLPAPPAVRIGVREARSRKETALLTEPLDDVVVHLEHAATHEGLRSPGEATGLVHRGSDFEPGALPHGEVLLAVPRRGVHQPGAVFHAHERRPVDHRGGIAPRTLEDHAEQVTTREFPLDRGRAPADRLRDHRQARGGQEEASRPDSHHGILRVGIGHEASIRGKRPGRRRPCHRLDGQSFGRESPARVLAQRERHVDRRRRVVVVFDLGLGERGTVGRTPVDGAQPALHEAALHECGEGVEDRRLEAGIHGEVGTVPFAPDTEALEVLALHVHPVRCEFAATLAQRDPFDRSAPLAELLGHPDLDRHPVVVPAGEVRRVEAHQ
jgi:hypothetical protein